MDAPPTVLTSVILSVSTNQLVSVGSLNTIGSKNASLAASIAKLNGTNNTLTGDGTSITDAVSVAATPGASMGDYGNVCAFNFFTSPFVLNEGEGVSFFSATTTGGMYSE